MSGGAARTLVTFPGKLGDALWMLPTAREIARQAPGGKVDLMLGDYCEPLVELLRVGCSYLGTVWVNSDWRIQLTAPVSPRVPPHCAVYGQSYHLGYEGWPTAPLPAYIATQAGIFTKYWVDAERTKLDAVMAPPWVSVPPDRPLTQPTIYLGWTDEWFELKLGLSLILGQTFSSYAERGAILRQPAGSRWMTEAEFLDGDPYEWHTDMQEASWLDTALTLMSCALYVGDLSAQWVLANALGIPCVVVEPSIPRHNPIFWWDGPIEADGKPRNVMVRGGDGQPTFDARAVVKAVREALERWEALRGAEARR